jgi:hypothetical protein
MFRLMSLVFFFIFIACEVAAADCRYGDSTNYSQGSQTCQLGEVRECNAGAWTVPGSGFRRCTDTAVSTLRLTGALAEFFPPGRGDQIDHREDRVDLWAPDCDGHQECSFTPSAKLMRGDLGPVVI